MMKIIESPSKIRATLDLECFIFEPHALQVLATEIENFNKHFWSQGEETWTGVIDDCEAYHKEFFENAIYLQEFPK